MTYLPLIKYCLSHLHLFSLICSRFTKATIKVLLLHFHIVYLRSSATMASSPPLPNGPSLDHARQLKEKYIGTCLQNAPVPSAVLDLAKVESNSTKMLEAVDALGCGWRAHIKTHKVSSFSLIVYKHYCCPSWPYVRHLNTKHKLRNLLHILVFLDQNQLESLWSRLFHYQITMVASVPWACHYHSANQAPDYRAHETTSWSRSPPCQSRRLNPPRSREYHATHPRI